MKELAVFGKYLRDQGLFTFIFQNVVFVVPPLCINQVELDEGLEIIENALTQVSDLAIE
jgi:adenosylmethionine-8-amino-7-oxononanoate aminotransferase